MLTDYANMHKLSRQIVESELVGVSTDYTSRVRTVNRVCFLVFCRDLRHVQLIRELGSGSFEATTLPDESDLVYGYARWRLLQNGDGTRLDSEFHFAMESYKWVPSFISRFVARSVLKADAKEFVEGVEKAVHVQRRAAANDATTITGSKAERTTSSRSTSDN